MKRVGSVFRYWIVEPTLKGECYCAEVIDVYMLVHLNDRGPHGVNNIPALVVSICAIANCRKASLSQSRSLVTFICKFSIATNTVLYCGGKLVIWSVNPPRVLLTPRIFLSLGIDWVYSSDSFEVSGMWRPYEWDKWWDNRSLLWICWKLQAPHTFDPQSTRKNLKRFHRSLHHQLFQEINPISYGAIQMICNVQGR